MWLSDLSSDVLFTLQGKSRTSVPGKAAAGNLPAQTSWRVTTASTRDKNPTSACCVRGPSPAPTTWLCTWRDTSDAHTHTEMNRNHFWYWLFVQVFFYDPNQYTDQQNLGISDLRNQLKMFEILPWNLHLIIWLVNTGPHVDKQHEDWNTTIGRLVLQLIYLTLFYLIFG